MPFLLWLQRKLALLCMFLIIASVLVLPAQAVYEIGVIKTIVVLTCVLPPILWFISLIDSYIDKLAARIADFE